MKAIDQICASLQYVPSIWTISNTILQSVPPMWVISNTIESLRNSFTIQHKNENIQLNLDSDWRIHLIQIGDITFIRNTMSHVVIGKLEEAIKSWINSAGIDSFLKDSEI
jgi:DNA-binding LytR/AlgR family response regulator